MGLGEGAEAGLLPPPEALAPDSPRHCGANLYGGEYMHVPNVGDSEDIPSGGVLKFRNSPAGRTSTLSEYKFCMAERM